MANDFVKGGLLRPAAGTARTFSMREVIKEELPKGGTARVKLVNEAAAQRKNGISVSLDDSTSIEPYRNENDDALNDLFSWGKSDEKADLVEMRISTVADTLVQYGPERLSDFQVKPVLRYVAGSNGGLGLKEALDFYEMNRESYKKFGLVFVHDFQVHDLDLLEAQIQRLHQIESRYSSTFAAYPVGIGICDERILKRVSSKRKGKILSSDYRFTEVIKWLKCFAATLATDRFLAD